MQILSISPVLHPLKLPYPDNILSLYSHLASCQHPQQGRGLQVKRSCYLMAKNMTDAYLIFCFCLGGKAVLPKMRERTPQGEQRVNEDIVQFFQVQFQDYRWDGNILDIFMHNSRKFCDCYIYYAEHILPKFNQKESQNLFKELVQNSVILHNVKIRLWKDSKITQKYRSLQREYQKQQLEMRSDNTYLVFGQLTNKCVNIGMFQLPTQIHSQNFRQSQKPQQSQQQFANRPTPLSSPKDAIKQSKNPLDFNKKPVVANVPINNNNLRNPGISANSTLQIAHPISTPIQKQFKYDGKNKLQNSSQPYKKKQKSKLEQMQMQPKDQIQQEGCISRLKNLFCCCFFPNNTHRQNSYRQRQRNK